MFMTYLWNSIIILSYSQGSFCAIVVLVLIHRPFLLINLSHHEVVPAKSIIDISMASLLASIKIIFVETAIPFFLWSVIQFLTYSSRFGHLGAHEHKVFYSYLLWLNRSFASSILVSSSLSEVSQNAIQLPSYHVFQRNSRLQFWMQYCKIIVSLLIPWGFSLILNFNSLISVCKNVNTHTKEIYSKECVMHLNYTWLHFATAAA